MEKLLHYIWKYKLFPLKPLQTTDGLTLEVIDPGTLNRDAGPDFFNAKIKLDGTTWVGNIEIHGRAADWYAHGHHEDTHYNNVILHVTETADRPVVTQDGKTLPQLIVEVPGYLRENYEELCRTTDYPRCHRIIPQIDPFTVHSWMNALLYERLEQRARTVAARVEKLQGDWERAYFITLSRNFGFGINGDAFEVWAQHIPLQAVAHHRDNLFQIEAIFMGQAGLLDFDTIPKKYRDEAIDDDYYPRLKREYDYLAHKFALTPMDAAAWKFLRLRPQNFPHVRIAQLTQLYYNQTAGFSRLLEARTLEELHDMLSTHATPYWESHYTFGCPSHKNAKALNRFIEPYRHQYRRPAAVCLRTNPRQRQILRTGFAILRTNQGGKQLYHAPMGRMRYQSGQRLGFASTHPTEKRVLRPEILSALPLRL